MTWKYDVFSEFCRCMFVHDLNVRCVFGVLQMHVLCMTWMYDGRFVFWGYGHFSEFCRCTFVHDLEVRRVFGVLQMHVCA